MYITKINNQSRRDFWADMKCEHCDYVEKNVSGYDDDNFHRNVIPQIKCKECGKTASNNYRPLTTKYGPNEIV